ncbi:MAG: caspase family protein [Saprospiraceae bacterium]|nr:caspase family protein [Saprospiraceae bacterium]
MKLKYLLLVLLLVVAGSIAHAQTSRKIALLIAVGDYPEHSGWQKINSSNDAALVREVLLRQGFKERDITIIKEAEATRKGILRAIQKYLVDAARPGDVLYFQFSGHGQQVADDNGDEIDGFDEAIVPFDSPMRYGEGGNRGQYLIRDEELGKLFSQARKRIGPKGNLLVILDSCHSGTGTRGMATARGTDRIMADSSYIAQHIHHESENGMLPTENGSDLAPMVAFFGSSASQLNFETRDERGVSMGSLTYALCKKLGQASASTTYRGLFDQIRMEMARIASRQQPQVEGTLDQQVFGGGLVEIPNYIPVKRCASSKYIEINTGWMHGMYEGTVVGLYPPETRDPTRAKALRKGIITTSGPFESMVTLDSALQKQIAVNAWIYILERNFGDLKARVKIQLDARHPIASALRKRITTIPVIQEDHKTADLHVLQNGETVQLMSGDLVLAEADAHTRTELAVERFVRKIQSWAQVSYLRGLQVENQDLKLDIEIVPVDFDRKTRQIIQEIPKTEKTDSFGNMRFRGDDVFRIRVSNPGNYPVYFTILDLSPDNKVEILAPNPQETPEEFRILPGKTIELKQNFELEPPYGTELLKLIVTDVPIDLRPIDQNRGINTKSNLNPLERLFAQTYFNEDCMKRGGKTANVSAGFMHIETVAFIIEQ